MVRTVWGLVLATLIVGVGCGTQVGGGGATGGGATGGGVAEGGGGGVVEGPCPAEAPSHGAWCDEPVTCMYSRKVWACTPAVEIVTEVRCEDGAWYAPVPATCSAVSATPSCDPFGTWHVHLEWPEDAFFADFSSNDFDLVISQDAAGIVLVTGPDSVQVGINNCTLKASWSLSESSYEMDGETFSTWEDQRLTLALSGDTATGTAERECTGECGGVDTGKATATRATD